LYSDHYFLPLLNPCTQRFYYSALHGYHIFIEFVLLFLCRCLLDQKALPVLKIIRSIFSLILTFSSQLTSQTWEHDASTDQLHHPSFTQLQQTYSSFHEQSRFLFKGNQCTVYSEISAVCMGHLLVNCIKLLTVVFRGSKFSVSHTHPAGAPHIPLEIQHTTGSSVSKHSYCRCLFILPNLPLSCYNF